MRTITEIIPEEYNNKKLYNYLKGKMQMSSKLIRNLKTYPEGMMINGEHFRTVDIIHTGDVLTINIIEEQNMSKLGSTLPDVVYEDDDLLIVNKPALLPIHESHNHQGDTLANSVALHLYNEGKASTFRAVGRLDKGTSGLVVCALNSHAASKLNAKIKKEYLAIPTGFYEGSGTIDAPIYRPDPMKTYRTVDERGDYAITHWESIKSSDTMSLLRVRIETGRTHQIRVHFAHLGTPLYGDQMYGVWNFEEEISNDDNKGQNFIVEPQNKATDINHQCLHCGKLTLIHPVTNKELTLEAPMPDDMQRIADRI